MSTTLTIRNLDESVKQMLRVQAATHGRAMEAEARDILTRAVMKTDGGTPPLSKIGKGKQKSACGAVRGIWKGRLSTAEVMSLTRGE
ncbi:MAG: FitA-like ribbon-helix-helix domain-containing protein [Terrimicrobiaceae bacterium]